MTALLKLVDMPEPLIWRSTDPAEVNAIFNDTDVHQAVGVPGCGPLDASTLLMLPGTVVIMARGGVVMFVADDPGIYNVHTAFLKEHRGAHAIECSLAAYRYMFTNTDCMVLQTMVPTFNRAADWACRRVGFRYEFMRDKVWPRADGDCDVKYYSMSYRDWLWRTPELAAVGHAFHEKLDSERKRFGAPPHSHPDDPAHNIAVGSALEMVYAGQIEKAVILYAQWARFSGYQPISLVSRGPAILLDIGDALIQVLDGDFKVILLK